MAFDPRRLMRLVAAGAVFLLPWLAPAQALDIQRVRSPGGVEAWLVTDRRVPVVSTALAFRGGATLDPTGKEGLANLVSSLLDEGAGPLDSAAFQRRLEDLSISLRFDAGRDNFGGSLRTLRRNLDAAFDLLRLAITEPRFEAAPVGRMRAQIVAGLRRQSQNPRYLASRRWFETVFADHPYRHSTRGTEASLAAIDAGDLRDFVARRLARDNLMIAVVGDVTAEALAPLLDSTFGTLPLHAAPHDLAEARLTLGGVQVIERDIPQSIVIFGHGGVKRDDPDYYAARLMNYVLGGSSFTSRLTGEIREKRGLAYSVNSRLSMLRHAGLYLGSVATQNGRVAQSLDLVRREWGRMRDDGVTVAELAAAKTYINGSFPLSLTSSGRIARVLLAMQLEDLGIDYLGRRAGLIDAVTLGDVARTAKRLLDPDALTVVVVGAPKDLDPAPRKKAQ